MTTMTQQVHGQNKDQRRQTLRDRPFNLQRGGGGGGGGLWFFVLFRKSFSDNTRVRIFIFFVANFFSRIQH